MLADPSSLSSTLIFASEGPSMRNPICTYEKSKGELWINSARTRTS